MKRIFLLLQICVLYITTISARSVWVSGESAAITLYYDGVYVNGTYVVNEDGKRYDPFRDSNILAGDLIIGVNDEKVMSIEEFHEELRKDQDDMVDLSILRDGAVLDKTLMIFKGNRDVPISGLYVKDKITGIGTITYFDEESKTFGALGHSLVSNDDIVIERGKLYEIPILSVRKSARGAIGEKIADTSSFVYLGEARENTVLGIYGTYVNKSDDAMLIDVLAKEEISLGTAYMLTVLEGNLVERFEISVDKVDLSGSNPGKGIQFSIKDQRLLNKTGGIVQGMSGSPIVQNGKLVGAVTHVLINDPLKGYGIFIENMLDAAQ